MWDTFQTLRTVFSSSSLLLKTKDKRWSPPVRFLSAGDRLVGRVHCRPLSGQTPRLVSATLTYITPVHKLSTMSKLGEFSSSWCFPSRPKVTWWCRSWGRTWGRCWSCSGCQKKRSSIWFIRCSEVWRWRTLLWSHIVDSLLVDVIVLWIKSLFSSSITVHSLCWYNSQGKFSLNTLCVRDKHCSHV